LSPCVFESNTSARWVSLLPCNASDPRQLWLSRPAADGAARQIVASSLAVRVGLYSIVTLEKKLLNMIGKMV
jgi:hypothetical protein